VPSSSNSVSNSSGISSSTPLIAHRFPIEDAVEASRLAQDESKGVFRVVVEP
jgi:hypothetical protein